MTNQRMIELLRADKKRSVFLQLYKSYPIVEKLICSKGGTKSDAEDIFQEALIIFYRKVSDKSFQLTVKASTYLYSVCRFLWANQLRKANKFYKVDIEASGEFEEDTGLYELIETETRYKVVEGVLGELGERCLKILQLFYYQKETMTAIAEKMNFKSEKIARNQKYKCLERAKNKLQLISVKGGVG